MEDTQPLLPRDQLLRDTFTPAERRLFGVILIVALTVYWLGDPRSFWLLGSLMIFGGLTPVILKTHEHSHPFFVDLLWPKFWLCSIPAWIIILQFIIGLTQNPLNSLSIGKSIYHSVDPILIWRPTSAAQNTTWLTVFGFSSAYILSTLLFIVPKSRSFFERILPPLCFGAVLVGVYGYIQKGLGLSKPLFTRGTGASDFFAFFPYDGHWAAFATLWCATCIAMALLSTRYDNSPIFIHSTGPWYLTGGALLGASGFLIQAPIPAAVLLLTLSIMLLIVAANFLANSKDPHRTPIALSCGLAACLSFASGLFRMFQDGTFSEQEAALRNAAYEMFRASPIFGWGMDSYEKLLPFYSRDTLLGQRGERAASDLLQLLSEVGLFGCILLIGCLSAFFIRYIRGKHNFQLSNHLLIGCSAIILLSIFDSPFMSPAVFFSFMVIFFSAFRWADLSRNKVDEVDAARPQLVTPESQRRVPFYTKPYQEKEK